MLASIDHDYDDAMTMTITMMMMMNVGRRRGRSRREGASKILLHLYNTNVPNGDHTQI